MRLLIVHDREGAIDSIALVAEPSELFSDVLLAQEDLDTRNLGQITADVAEVHEIRDALESGPESEEMQRAVELARQNYRVLRNRVVRV